MKAIATLLFGLIFFQFIGAQNLELHSSSGLQLSFWTGDRSGYLPFVTSFLRTTATFVVNDFGITTGLEYTIKGTDFEKVISYEEGGIEYWWRQTETTRLHYIIFPLIASYRLENFRFSGGVYWGLKMTGSETYIRETFEDGTRIDVDADEGRVNEWKYNQPLFGLEFSIGFQFGSSTISIMYCGDLKSIDNFNESNMYNNLVRLSYRIRICKW